MLGWPGRPAREGLGSASRRATQAHPRAEPEMASQRSRSERVGPAPGLRASRATREAIGIGPLVRRPRTAGSATPSTRAPACATGPGSRSARLTSGAASNAQRRAQPCGPRPSAGCGELAHASRAGPATCVKACSPTTTPPPSPCIPRAQTPSCFSCSPYPLLPQLPPVAESGLAPVLAALSASPSVRRRTAVAGWGGASPKPSRSATWLGRGRGSVVIVVIVPMPSRDGWAGHFLAKGPPPRGRPSYSHEPPICAPLARAGSVWAAYDRTRECRSGANGPKGTIP